MHIAYRDDGCDDWKVHLREGKKAPLTTREVRFAALNSDEQSLTSQSWKIEAQSNGEVYVRERGRGDAHISLHASGQAHMKSKSQEHRENVCNWTWTHGKRALQIVFLPRWGAPVADRPNQKIWARNDFLLGLDQDWGLAVTLMRVADGVGVNPPAPPRRAFLLSKMRMADTAETLWVAAEQIYPPCEISELERRLELEASLTGMGGTLSREKEDKVLDIHLMGTTNEGSGFIVPLHFTVSRKAGNDSA